MQIFELNYSNTLRDLNLRPTYLFKIQHFNYHAINADRKNIPNLEMPISPIPVKS